MVLIKEYRIPMPVSVEEYRIAQRYIVSKISKQQTGHGEGIEIVVSEPYEDKDHGTGTYTHKIFHLASKIPGWIKAVVPTSALQIEEKAWNAYPYCKTVYSCPFMGDRFNITIETRYLPDKGDSFNALKLPDDQVKNRQIDTIDIAFDPVDPGRYKKEEDPTLFVSEKTGRGKLTKEWRDKVDPVMCSYKYCSVEFRVFGMQTRVESYIHKVGLRDIFLSGHRQAFCWIDEWFGMTMEDVLKIEEETRAELDKLIHEDEFDEEGDAEEEDEFEDEDVSSTSSLGSISIGGKNSPKSSPKASPKGSPKGSPAGSKRNSVEASPMRKKAHRNSLNASAGATDSPKGKK